MSYIVVLKRFLYRLAISRLSNPGFYIDAGAPFVLSDTVVSVLQYIASIDFVIKTVESKSGLVLGF